MLEEPKKISEIQEIMRMGVKIGKFYEIIHEHKITESLDANADDEDRAYRKGYETVLYSLMDHYSEIFEAVLY